MINPIGSNSKIDQVYVTREKYNKNEQLQNNKDENGVMLEIGGHTDRSATYNRPSTAKPNIEEIKKLWEQTEKATQSLRSLVRELINRQGFEFKDVMEGRQALIPDEKAIAEAEELISEDGEWGVEEVSNRIVEFAKAISGEDKSKLGILRDAIRDGFSQAKDILGGELPEISKRTYDEIMNKLDKWENEE